MYSSETITKLLELEYDFSGKDDADMFIRVFDDALLNMKNAD
jgi:hypothetical protein